MAQQRVGAEQAAQTDRGLMGDAYAFTLAFMGVVLEGLDVAFIVLTCGANQHSIPLAAVGAVTAIGLVVAVGLAVRAPLARVPENTLKFGVGVLLTSFGTFWAAEGGGAARPGSDLSLLAVMVFVLIGALGAVAVLRRARERHLLASADTAGVTV